MGLFSFLRGTKENSFSIGDGTDSDKKIEAEVPGASKPALRFNHVMDKWEVSHDGTTYSEIGEAPAGGGDFLVMQVFS